MTHSLTRVTTLAICVMLCVTSASKADPETPLRVTVRQGLGGRWWLSACPVTLEVALDRGSAVGDLTWVTDVARGPARQTIALNVQGPARQVFRLVEPAPANPLSTNALELAGRPVRDVTTPTSPNGLISTPHLVVVLGDAPGYAAVEKLAAAEGDQPPVAIAHADPLELPETVFGYGPTRLVVLRGATATALAPGQVAALLDWVHLGGRLVIAPGTPPASQRDAAWLAPILPAAPGPRLLGAGTVELLGSDETALDTRELKQFLTVRLAPMEGLRHTLFGTPTELEVMRAAQAAWANRQDGLIGVGLIAWALVLWLLSRLPDTGRSPWGRLLFRPGVALLIAALFLARRPAPAPVVQAFASLVVDERGDTGSGDVVLAVSGTGAPVALAAGRVRQGVTGDRRTGWRLLYAPPATYRLRVAPSLALEGLDTRGSVPDLVDLAAVVPMGGAWNADLSARDRQTLDGWIENGSSFAVEAGYLMVSGFACPLPRIEPGTRIRGPFRIEHVSLLKPPAGASEGDALPEVLRQVMRGFSFPADGLPALPHLSSAVVARLAVPADRYAPPTTSAVTYATVWLPTQVRR